MQHVTIAKYADAGLQAFCQVAACQPVNDDMVGCPGDQHLCIDAAFDCFFQFIKQYVVGHEVSICEPDTLFCPADGFDVHIANRESRAHRVGLAHINEWVEAARIVAFNVPGWMMMEIPEIGRSE